MIYIDIYRYKQYIINIKIVKISITITATAMMLVINNNNNYNCNNNNNNNNKSGGGEREKKSSEDFHIYSYAKKFHETLANFNVYFLDIHRNLAIVRKRKKIL